MEPNFSPKEAYQQNVEKYSELLNSVKKQEAI
jgi:hypothetical protein